MQSFDGLSENEVLTLAISNEEEGRVYLNLACRMPERYPSSAKLEAERSHDVSVRKLPTTPADVRSVFAERLDKPVLAKDARAHGDETARRLFVLQYVQPGLAGLMDGSVST